MKFVEFYITGKRAITLKVGRVYFEAGNYPGEDESIKGIRVTLFRHWSSIFEIQIRKFMIVLWVDA